MGYKKRRKQSDELTGLSVRVYNNNIEKALRKFKKLVKESKLMVELKEKQYFTPKSELRRRKSKKAKKFQKNFNK